MSLSIAISITALAIAAGTAIFALVQARAADRSANAAEDAAESAKRSANAAERTSYEERRPDVQLRARSQLFTGLVLEVTSSRPLDSIRLSQVMLSPENPVAMAWRGLRANANLDWIPQNDGDRTVVISPVEAGKTYLVEVDGNGKDLPEAARVALRFLCQQGSDRWTFIKDTGEVDVIPRYL